VPIAHGDLGSLTSARGPSNRLHPGRVATSPVNMRCIPVCTSWWLHDRHDHQRRAFIRDPSFHDDPLRPWALSRFWLPTFQPKFPCFPGLDFKRTLIPAENHHLGCSVRFPCSIAWTGSPGPRGHPRGPSQHRRLGQLPQRASSPSSVLAPFFTRAIWGVYAENPDTLNKVFGTSEVLVQRSSPSWVASSPDRRRLWLTDNRPPPTRRACLFVIAATCIATNFGIGHSIREILEAHRSSSGHNSVPVGGAWCRS